jgi:glycerol-3-phosphate dehydrogenase
MKRDPQALAGRDVDVLVIGGGIAGAWTVWEAASRGLSAALIELEDFGQATSWSSLKTAHGGLRHLQRLDLPGFRESVLERRALLRVAPRIVRPLSFAVLASGVVERTKYVLGGVANDLLSFDRNDGLEAEHRLGPSRVVEEAEARTIGAGPLGGSAFVWPDAQITHTERLLMGILHAAHGASAVLLNRCRLESCERTSDAFDLRATDARGGGEVRFKARSIVNATGAALEATANLLGETCGSPRLIRGVNVVLSRDLTPRIALGVRDRGRFLFLVPWLGRTLLGTIYDDGRPPVETLVRELLEAGRRAFPWAELRDEDACVVHAGHVPGGDGEPLYRSRLITHKDPRILSILTAKYTTARATAEAAVDALGRGLSRSLPPSTSAERELPMARPLEGSLGERIRLAQETEMALGTADAVRGRLTEGARGESVDSGASEA